MSTRLQGITFKNSELPLLTETIMDQEGIYKDGDFITITNLLVLKQVLPSLRLPPNVNTLSVDNTILLLDASGGTLTNTLTETDITLTDNSGKTNTMSNSNIQIIDTNTNFQTSINEYSINVVDVSNSKNVVIDITQGTLTNNDGAITFTQMTGNTFKSSDAYGIQSQSILDNTALTITDFAGSQYTSLSGGYLSSPSLSFNDGTYTSSIGMVANDYVVDANGARLLLNGGDSEFYIGQYSSSSAPCIISGGSGGLYLSMNSRGGTTSLGDIDNAFNSTKITVDDGAYRVNTNAIMMTAYNSSYILPICYTHKISSNFSYIGVNNSWENVYQSNTLVLPTEFFNTNNTFWDYKIEFSINLRDLSNPADKGLALYFEILDGNSNVYTPFLYNFPTPFTRHSNASTYNFSSSNMLTFTWTDVITFNTNITNPLTFSLWWYGDDNNAPNFDAVLSLTRTNLV